MSRRWATQYPDVWRGWKGEEYVREDVFQRGTRQGLPATDGGRGPWGWQGEKGAKRILEPDGFRCLDSGWVPSQGGAPRVVFTPGEP